MGGESLNRSGSIDLHSLSNDEPFSLVNLPTVTSLCFSSNASLSDFAPVPSPPLRTPSRVDFVELDGDLLLANLKPPRTARQPRAAVIAVPTPPRLMTIATQRLSIGKWANAIVDADSAHQASFSGSCGDGDKAWIAEGSMYPPEVYTSAVVAARDRAYQRIRSDYQSTSSASPPRVASKIPKASPKRHGLLTQRLPGTTRATASPPSSLRPGIPTAATRAVLPNSPRSQSISPTVSSNKQISRSSPHPADTLLAQAPSTAMSTYEQHFIPFLPASPLPSVPYGYSVHERRQSITTHDMITSLRSQCATVAVHNLGWDGAWRYPERSSSGESTSVSKSRASRGARRVYAPALESHYASRLPLAYPGISYHPQPTDRLRQRWRAKGPSQHSRNSNLLRKTSATSSSSTDEMVWPLTCQATTGINRWRSESGHRHEPSERRRHHRWRSRGGSTELANYTKDKTSATKVVRFAARTISIPYLAFSESDSEPTQGEGEPEVADIVGTLSGKEPSNSSAPPVRNLSPTPTTPVFERAASPTRYSPWLAATEILLPKEYSKPQEEAVALSHSPSAPVVPTALSQSSHFFRRTFSRRSLSRIIKPESTVPKLETRETPQFQAPQRLRRSDGIDKQTRETQAKAVSQRSRIPLPLRTLLKLGRS
ncbi:hypothetical protein BKA70DRAFT_473219 [Coprinopsis sp. MPI-PUGE-AT-0042]|nr:hypothetical protein BKA70DRAFT_473219 [Coprinopsis sp. MPI-PUGE-AT-0042]